MSVLAAPAAWSTFPQLFFSFSFPKVTFQSQRLLSSEVFQGHPMESGLSSLDSTCHSLTECPEGTHLASGYKLKAKGPGSPPSCPESLLPSSLSLFFLIWNFHFFLSFTVSNYFFFNSFIYFRPCGSSLLSRLFSSGGKQGLLSSCNAQASHRGGFSHCRARAPGSSGFSSCGTWAQSLQLPGSRELWHMGLVAPWHVGSSQTGDRTCVS